MESVLALLVGLMVAASIYMILGRNLIRFIFGLVLASNAVNLLLFTGGRLSSATPPLIPEGALTPAGPVANALPQALMLTAIVIGFALLVFIFVLFYRAYEELGTVDTEFMRRAEPPDGVTPPPTCAIEGEEA